MPGARLPMRNIRDVLRLTAAGMSSRKIAASLSIGATTVIDCLHRARRAGLTWPLPDWLDDVMLELRLYPPQATTKEQRPLPNWAVIQRELKRPGVTLELLWQEYRGAPQRVRLFALLRSSPRLGEARFADDAADARRR